MTVEEEFDRDLHGGKEIEGMSRTNSYFLSTEDDGSQHIMFDNGNFYILKDEKIIKKTDQNNDFFLDKHIINAIYKVIELNQSLLKNYRFTNSDYDNQIEFYSENETEENKSRNLLIRIILNRNSKTIDIPNIMIPYELKYNSLGKKIIKEIFQIAQQHNYRLQLVQMVESFYEKMVKRGATIVYPLDVVEITNETILS